MSLLINQNLLVKYNITTYVFKTYINIKQWFRILFPNDYKITIIKSNGCSTNSTNTLDWVFENNAKNQVYCVLHFSTKKYIISYILNPVYLIFSQFISYDYLL